MQVAELFLAELGAVGSSVGLWACLAGENGYRAKILNVEEKYKVVLEKLTAGTLETLAESELLTLTAEWHAVQFTVAGGVLTFKIGGETVVTVADGTFTTGFGGIDGTVAASNGNRQFSINGKAVDTFEREEEPLAGGKWKLLPGAANTGQCFSAEFGWAPSGEYSGAFWEEGESERPQLPLRSGVVGRPG